MRFPVTLRSSLSVCPSGGDSSGSCRRRRGGGGWVARKLRLYLCPLSRAAVEAELRRGRCGTLRYFAGIVRLGCRG